MVEFTTTRKLDCGIDNTFVVQIDVEMDLITAWNPNKNNLSYHGQNKYEFVQIFSPIGTCEYAVAPTKDNAH